MSTAQNQHTEEWIPKTKLGRLVASGEITTIKEALNSGLPLKEVEIIDQLINVEEEVLDVNMVQRMTDSGRRVKFRTQVVVGNRNGYVGLAEAKDEEVGPAIRKAIRNAKLNLIDIRRGCGSWECGCGTNHSIPIKVTGNGGSTRVTLLPAPNGIGLAAGETAKKVLELAGIKDIWSSTKGETRTTINFGKATFDALKKTAMVKMPERDD
ncbi:Ribosomal protein S5 [Methanonatronarchaeum thermophilum]|uniref:Small ribosomal subunit protein uS5 n=1 Tax=Methanonatronarchaeum thermophilum TaxID=1927129 RepID=A0A1Y3GHG4_9EURY|nr:30S ribosomal protein S5 [Methanonatronarchaeum thermophilum]OUJ18826.1 Ribosomal protein S5 [Methanonatronarchaeum thermophilum]